MLRRLTSLVAFAVVLVASTSVEAQSERSSRPVARRAAPQTGVPSRWEGAPSERSSRQVAPASHVEVVEGDYYGDGAYIDHGHVESGCSSCGGGGCGSCSADMGLCNTCSVPRQFCICFPSHGWVHAEYLNWYQSGMNLPALVTSNNGTPARAAAGVLPGASILYGGSDDYQDDYLNGFRIRFGWWLRALPGWGIEGEYAGLGENIESFYRNSTGSPVLARPFFNVLTGAEDAELVAFPGVASGNIGVTTTSQLDGAAVRLRHQICGNQGCGYSQLACQSVPTSSRFDFTIGYRFWELDESVMIRERLNSQTASEAFDITDNFRTRNQFNGTELGVVWQGRRGWWSLDALMRLGIGNVHQTVTIDGSTQITENGATTSHETGFLAQRTNIGSYDRDQFTIIPELGLTLGYQMTKRVRVTAGYSLIYMGNVVRPGDQISLDVNPNLLAPELTPFTGALRPQFQFTETDYWVQGLSFGAEFRW